MKSWTLELQHCNLTFFLLPAIRKLLKLLSAVGLISGTRFKAACVCIIAKLKMWLRESWLHCGCMPSSWGNCPFHFMFTQAPSSGDLDFQILGCLNYCVILYCAYTTFHWLWHFMEAKYPLKHSEKSATGLEYMPEKRETLILNSALNQNMGLSQDLSPSRKVL